MGEAIFTKLETIARWIQLKYMEPRRTTEVVEPGRIRFHPQDARGWVLKEYQARLKELRIT
ncbi:hypothetical protein AMJ51_02140 [Microgenomates bacterium DG_75]|nr:MAG: hypothetical protein AMJ51_02140 [Microgenomates bacterium DG_75]